MDLPELPEELRVGLPGAVLAYIGALETAVAALQAEVAEVRARLNQDSRNSSRPPSSDPPAAQAKRPKAEPGQRQPGGQPGHLGHHRAVVSEEAVDQMITVRPD